MRTLILGTTALARDIVKAANSRKRRSCTVIGAVAESEIATTQRFPCPILGPLDDLERIVAEYQPGRIVIALEEWRQCLPLQQLLKLRIQRHIVIEDGVRLYERFTGKLAIAALKPSSVIFSRNFQPSVLTLAVARGIALFAACIGLILLTLFFSLIAIAIKLDSDGPLLFMQERTGLGGRRFKMLKFRTMYPPAAGKSRSEWVRDNNDRITRVGRWLRRYRLDELPQFINVLRGDMGLVGPRPHPVSNYELFTLVSRNIPECGEQIPYYALRSLVRPGITGWAQVRYQYANSLDEEMEKLCYDLYYIKHCSFWLDLRIIFETFKIVLLGREQRTSISSSKRASELAARPSLRSTETLSEIQAADYLPDDGAAVRTGIIGAFNKNSTPTQPISSYPD
ncbi:MAG TPA: sugar transferase [Gammaproteobacteria bacterium]